MTEEILRRTLRTVMSVEDNVRRLLARFPELRVASADGAVSWAVGRLYSDELLDAVSAGLAYLPACSMRADGAGTDELSGTYERVLPGRVAMPRVWPRRVARRFCQMRRSSARSILTVLSCLEFTFGTLLSVSILGRPAAVRRPVG